MVCTRSGAHSKVAVREQPSGSPRTPFWARCSALRAVSGRCAPAVTIWACLLGTQPPLQPAAIHGCGGRAP
eukprot:scaffold58854_cov72-Phaeocystis_antarctica.AAC.2